MNVKQLREMLSGFPDEMTVIVDRHSDFATLKTVKVEKVVDCNDDWFEHFSEYRQRTAPERVVDCLYLSDY